MTERILDRLIYILEGNFKTEELLKVLLLDQGFQVSVYKEADSIPSNAAREQPLCVLLGSSVNKSDSIRFCGQMHGDPFLAAIPIVFIPKDPSPVEIHNIASRVNDIERATFTQEASDVLRFKHFQLDQATMSVMVAGDLVYLTTTEFRLLQYLALHPHQTFSRDELLAAVWGRREPMTIRSVDVYIKRLRRKIEPNPAAPCYIRTSRDAGYSFTPCISNCAPPA